MNFWERVEYLLDQKDMTRKELAMTVGFSPSNISKGKREDSYPSAETAVAIARFLNTSVEYLVTGIISQPGGDRQKDFSDLYRYARTIRNLDSIPDDRRKILETMINDMGGLDFPDKQ